MTTGKFGPNVRRLIAHKMSLDAIPRGGGFVDGLEFLASKDNIVTSAQKAKHWVAHAVQAVRSAAEPNPWKDADDETIAGELLSKIESASDKRAELMRSRGRG